MLKVTPLGAGREVGRSCLLVSFQDTRLLLDCGLHMGFTDERRFPHFDLIESVHHLDAVLITHFHLDHCGALPYLTGRLSLLPVDPVLMLKRDWDTQAPFT